MQMNRLITYAALLAILVAPVRADEKTPARETLLLDFGWRYQKGDQPVNHWAKLTKTGNYDDPNAPALTPGIGLSYDDSKWRPLDLPHDATIEGLRDRKRNNIGKGFLPTDVGWYRRHFNLPKEDEGRRIFVEFDGVFRDMTIYVNQFLAGGHKSGSGSVRFDITDFVNFGGSNVLAVRVDARDPEGWWYEGGGIYRHVWMIKTGPVHIPYGGVQVLTWFKTDPEQAKPFFSDEPVGPAKVRVKTALFNTLPEPAAVEVRVRLVAPDGREVAVGRVNGVAPTRREVTLPVQLKVRQPALWSLDTPQLYRAEVEVVQSGRRMDAVTQSFGIRTIRFDANQGFFLNGKPVKLNGGANHYDHACVGSAVPDTVNEFRIRQMKAFGFNAYRCTCRPDNPVLLDICDRLGMLVMEEARSMNGTREALADVRDLVLRDRNHPCIVIWNFANEEVALYRLPQGARLAQSNADEFRAYDPTRPVTMSRNAHYDAANAAAVDLLGFNYFWPYFLANDRCYDADRQKFPHKPFIETEMGSTYTGRGMYEETFGWLTEYDRGNFYVGAMTRDEVKRQMARPWLCGGFIWCCFDYHGEPYPIDEMSWPANKKDKGRECPMLVRSWFGTFDTCGYPKDEAYYYKAWWRPEPSLHLFPHWNFPEAKIGQPIEVVAYSNAEEVELFVNGKSAGRKAMPIYDLVSWQVPYQPGAIEAVGYKAGKAILRQRRETTGPAVAVKLESLNGLRFVANREDAAVVKVAVMDAQGREVPDAVPLVKFRVEGPIRILGTDNGNPWDLQSDKLPERRLWAGLAQVIVQAMETPGPAKLIAEADGLKPAVIELNLADGPRRPFVPTTIKAEEAMMLWWDGKYSYATRHAPITEHTGPTRDQQEAQTKMLLSPIASPEVR